MIKNIIFDCGRVIVKFNPNGIVEKMNLGDEENKILSKEIFKTEVWQLLDKGIITKEEAYNIICSRIPENLYVYCREMLENWYKYIDEIPNTIELMKDLKNNNYNIYILSNFNSDYNKEMESIGIKNLLSGQIVSSEEKLLKPDKEIYLKLFDKYNLNPEECYFIDDKKENVEAGIKLGMKGFIFNNNIEELKIDLKNKGVNV